MEGTMIIRPCRQWRVMIRDLGLKCTCRSSAYRWAWEIIHSWRPWSPTQATSSAKRRKKSSHKMSAGRASERRRVCGPMKAGRSTGARWRMYRTKSYIVKRQSRGDSGLPCMRSSHDCDFFVQDGGGVVDKEAANDLHPCQGRMKHVSH